MTTGHTNVNQEHSEGALIWVETVTIPTYGIGRPDKNPMFLEKRVYQGSSGVVYPYPVVDKVLDDKTDQDYEAVFLENRWIKVMVLPELGGRVQMALDKTNGYHFVYYNSVIKPALVGLAGPWISGGIEFNWPQHHRPNTFGLVDWHVTENEDGSKTLWCSEIDRMHRTKGMHGLTIYPHRALLEIKVQLYNRTAEPQTFLWWANPAVHVNDDYQSVFPQDVHAVMDHGKRDVSSFPIATGTYYKVDYAPGTDISRYKNVPVPTSFMAHRSDYDFLGCYDHGRQAGMIHVANHHVAPGKKQWTWGHGHFGQTWDRQLTDQDGPYIELMCGCYTDNQPDFTWLMPYEQKSFTQVFMPYKQIGAVKNASTECAVNLDLVEGFAQLGVYVTGDQRGLRITLSRMTQILFETRQDLSPQRAWLHEVPVDAEVKAHELTVSVYDRQDEQLVSFAPLSEFPDDIPDPAQAALPPQAVSSTEQLFLTGQHLEQYRHATYDPVPYYEEALRRDPSDIRNNNALGLLWYRRGCFQKAEGYFRRAIETLTQRNPNPYDSEPYYHLGLALRQQGRDSEAFKVLYKAAWSAHWKGPAYFELARLACGQGRFAEALELADQALISNWVNHNARHLKVILLRHLGCEREALNEVRVAQDLDCLDVGIEYERFRLDGSSPLEINRITEHTVMEVALDYAQAGLWTEAAEFLQTTGVSSTLSRYYLAYFVFKAEGREKAQPLFKRASQQDPTYSFPNRLECIAVFETAMEINPQDAKAPYYLGTFFFARRYVERAIALWEQSRTLDPTFPTVWRNLGLAYMNKCHDAEAAQEALERAFELDSTDARVFFELDQLYKKRNQSPTERLARLDQHLALVNQRDDLTLERINLINRLGRYSQALDLLLSHRFHPWEGGEGKVAGQYVFGLVQSARLHLEQEQYQRAIDCLMRAKTYPHNLGEGKLTCAAENHIDYYLGMAHAGSGRPSESHRWLESAAGGSLEPVSAQCYNDQPPDMIYYQGMALQALGREDDAATCFNKLIDYGRQHLDDQSPIDYFAVSLPDFLVFDADLARNNRVHCHFMMGLGYLGLNQNEHARDNLAEVLRLDKAHLGASAALGVLEAELKIE